MKKNLGILLLLAVVLAGSACSTSDDNPVQPKRPVKGKQDQGDQVMDGGTGLTLQQVNACPYTTLTAVPSGYTLEMDGVWDYNSAYLLIHTASGDTTGEVYVGGSRLAGDCTLIWDSSPNQVCCDGTGTTCKEGTAVNGAKVLIRCN